MEGASDTLAARVSRYKLTVGLERHATVGVYRTLLELHRESATAKRVPCHPLHQATVYLTLEEETADHVEHENYLSVVGVLPYP